MHEERANFAREALEAVRAARLIQAVLAASQERDAAIPRDPVAILREEARVDGWESLRAGAEAETDEAAMQHWLAEQRELTNQMNAMYNNQDGEQEEDEGEEDMEEEGDEEDEEREGAMPTHGHELVMSRDGRGPALHRLPGMSRNGRGLLSAGMSRNGRGLLSAGLFRNGRGLLSAAPSSRGMRPFGGYSARAAASAASVTVTIGTSELISDDFVRGLYAMVNGAYGHQRVTLADIRHRLRMGDSVASGTANRVLHLAWRADGEVGDVGALVGCCSSTIDVPWCHEGCGHWGLLVVETNAQGTGVGRALVAAAEQRLSRAGLREVQMEYEFTVGDAHSERLRMWYEGTLGFRCDSAPPDRSQEGETLFRRCRKRLQRPRRRRAEGESSSGHDSASPSSDDEESEASSSMRDSEDDEASDSEFPAGGARLDGSVETPRRPTPRIVIPPEEPGPRADEADFEEVD